MKNQSTLATTLIAALLLLSCGSTSTDSIKELQLAAPAVGATSTTASTILFAWSAVDNATIYQYQCKGSDGQSVVSASTTLTEVLVTDLKSNSEYVFSVKAVAGKSESTEGTARATTLRKPSPTGLNVTSRSVDRLAFEWAASAGAVSYDYLLTADAQSDRSGNVNECKIELEGLSEYTLYNFSLRARVGNTEAEVTDYSDALTARTALSAPVDLAVGADQSFNSLSFGWTANANATAYRWQLSNDRDSSVRKGTADQNALSFSDLSSATAYTLTVQALAADQDCNSLFSEPFSVTTSRLPAPTRLTASNEDKTLTSIKFAWQAVDGVANYKYTLSDGAGNELKSGQTKECSAVMYGLTQNGVYTFRVASVESNGTLSDYVALTAMPLCQPDCVVNWRGGGDCLTVTAAVENATDGTATKPYVIYIKKGRYFEQMSLTKNYVVFVGDGADNTVITYDNYAGRDSQTNYVLEVRGNDFMAVDLTIENTLVNKSGLGITGTQAVALDIRGTRAVLYNCRVTGYQDTFRGHKAGCFIYCHDCYIEGNVDFIYGDSNMVFDSCTIYCNRDGSVITAPSTPVGQKYGITFFDCNLTGLADDQVDFNGSRFRSFCLGRPWHDEPKAVYIRCNEPSTLSPVGWTTMSDGLTATFAEYECYGEGATAERLAQRGNQGRQLSADEAAEYTLDQIFPNWIIPTRYKLPK